MSVIVCRPKSLSFDKLALAEARAVEINPANALERRTVERTTGQRRGPRRIAVLVARKWPATGVRLSVSFMDSAPNALRVRIIGHMNTWGDTANVVFSETNGVGEVRIARLDSPPDMAGYWSYIGTEILEIDKNEPTMNLEGFTMKVSDAEFQRVVRHEAGHTLGFEHEHMRTDLVNKIDRKKAISYFFRTQGWSPSEVDAQVLMPLATKSIMGTLESDPLSIMCYQLPAAIMKKGMKAIEGGKDINPKDSMFAAKLYPKKGATHQSSEMPDITPAGTVYVASESLPQRESFHLTILDEFRSDTTDNGDTAEFGRVLATYGGAQVVSSIRLRRSRTTNKEAADRNMGHENTAFHEIISVHEQIRAYTNRQVGSLPTDAELLKFGVNFKSPYVDARFV